MKNGGTFKYKFISDEIFQTISEKLNAVISEEQRNNIQLTIMAYATHSDKMPRISTARKDMKKLGDSLQRLKADISNLSAYGQQLIEETNTKETPKIFEALPKDIDILQKGVEAALNHLKNKHDPGGRTADVASNIMITGLKKVYEDITGKKATVTKDPYEESIKGKFIDFVETLLKEAEQRVNPPLRRRIQELLN